jgi:hypothetical protein
MKYLYLLLLFLGFYFPVFAAESVKLTCSIKDEISAKINAIDGGFCTQNKFLEIKAKDIFGISLKKFDEETVNKIMLDDVSNPNWLAQKGIYDLREHRLCLENTCDLILEKCSLNNSHQENEDQFDKCSNMIENIFEIQKTKIKTAVIENQRRKTRSTWREKFRAIEVRTHRYFIPNIINFAIEFQRFTEKITSFVLMPLS